MRRICFEDQSDSPEVVAGITSPGWGDDCVLFSVCFRQGRREQQKARVSVYMGVEAESPTCKPDHPLFDSFCLGPSYLEWSHLKPVVPSA